MTGTRFGVAAALAALWLAGAARADVYHSLSTQFVEVLVEGVPAGSRYVLEAKPVEVFNRGDFVMHLRFDATIPQPSQLRAGYEPIPDEAWVSFEPRTFTVGLGQTATGNVVLYVPKDPKLVGRRFQAMLYLHADPTKGSMLGVGLAPRLLFSVTGQGAVAAPAFTDFPQPLARLLPYESGAATGSLFFDCGTVTAENPWGEELTYEVVRDPGATAKVAIRPFETPLPDPAWLVTTPSTLVLPPYSRGTFAVAAVLPFSAACFGKTYVGALHTVARRASHAPVDTYNLVRVIVPDPALAGRTVTGTGDAR